MKISVHLEADSAEELQAFFTSFAARPAQYSPSIGRQHTFAKAEPVTDIQRSVIDGTFGVKSMEPESSRDRAEIEEPTEIVSEAPEEPVAKKARKPRGPNKPKQAPVDEQPVEPVRPAPKPETPQATRDDLLNVFSEYVQRYGVSFGYTDISSLLQKHLGDGIRKASDVPEGQLLEAIDAIKAAISENPFNRKRDYA